MLKVGLLTDYISWNQWTSIKVWWIYWWGISVVAKVVDSPPGLPRCCGRSSSLAGCGRARPCPRTPGRTWSRSLCCQSNRPTPSRASRARRWRQEVTAPGGCNHTCTIRCYPRCRLGLSRASPPHSWWRRWTPSLDNLQQSGVHPAFGTVLTDLTTTCSLECPLIQISFFSASDISIIQFYSIRAYNIEKECLFDGMIAQIIILCLQILCYWNYCYVLVTRPGVWNRNSIYRTINNS